MGKIELYRGGVTLDELNGKKLNELLAGKWWTPSLCYATDMSNRLLCDDDKNGIKQTRCIIKTTADISDCFADIKRDKLAVFLLDKHKYEIIQKRDTPMFYFDYFSSSLIDVHVGQEMIDAILWKGFAEFKYILNHYNGDIRKANNDWNQHQSLREGMKRDADLYNKQIQEIHDKTIKSSNKILDEITQESKEFSLAVDFLSKYMVNANKIVSEQHD